MNLVRAIVLASAALLLGGAAAPKLSGYLSADAVDGQAVIGAPPAPDSPRGQADRATYLATRELAGSPRWAQAIRDNDLWTGGALQRFACALGQPIDDKTLPKISRLLRRMELDARTVGTPPKDHFNRTRPPIGDDRPVCVPRADWMRTNASYPSGHAITGWAWGLVLAELAPSHASGLLEAGREIGDSRVICGVHYPSDVEAGRMLGASMVAEEHANAAFRTDLAAAKAELATARGPAPASCPAPTTAASANR